MDLERIDLNLLVVFNALIRQGRVSAVAKALAVSQPAVSKSLKRLRHLMGDELFIHTQRGMVPTPFAEHIAEPIAYALNTIDGALGQRISFDPANSTREFTVAMSDVGEIYFLPQIMDTLSREARGIRVSTVHNTAVNLRDEMESGRVDLAIGLLPQLKAGFFQRRLFQQRYVCMFRRGHALDKRKVGLSDFAEAEHIMVVAEGTGHGRVDEMLERQGIRRRVCLTMPHFIAVAQVLSSTDLVATVPERLAQRVAGPFGLAYVTHPAVLPTIAISLHWHSRMHRDPGNQWLRTFVFGLFADGSKQKSAAEKPVSN